MLIEELGKELEAINIARASQGLGTLQIECLLILNDASPDATALQKQHCDPLVAGLRTTQPALHLQVTYLTDTFENSYPHIRTLVSAGRYPSVLYNLDQCGHSQVDFDTMRDILGSVRSVEIFYTFAIQTLITFLGKSKPNLLAEQIKPFEIYERDLEGKITKDQFLGAAERLVFKFFKTFAK